MCALQYAALDSRLDTPALDKQTMDLFWVVFTSFRFKKWVILKLLPVSYAFLVVFLKKVQKRRRGTFDTSPSEKLFLLCVKLYKILDWLHRYNMNLCILTRVLCLLCTFCWFLLKFNRSSLSKVMQTEILFGRISAFCRVKLPDQMWQKCVYCVLLYNSKLNWVHIMNVNVQLV